jgi:predicted membrane channel-forming protein YqfA (hemolysin III family)
MENDERQVIVDEEHLKVLSIVYFVSAGMSALVSIFGLLYAFMGVFMFRVVAQAPQNQGDFPPEFGWIFAVFGLGMFALMITMGIFKLVAGLRLKKRQSRTFCLVIAGISCLGFPYGTLMGVFTFIVLLRPSVAKLFDGTAK